MFQRNDFGPSGGSVALDPAAAGGFGRARPGQSVAAPRPGLLADLELVTDLGQRIGSREWWRGLVVLALLLSAAWALAPGIRPLDAPAAPPMSESQWDEARAQSVSPLALGADTGRRMAPTEAVEPLAEIPERPSVDLAATLGLGDGFARVLERAGVAPAEAGQVAAMVGGAVGLDDLKAGTRVDLTLGRRANRHVPRPLDHLLFRARFDLNLAVERTAGGLQLKRLPIAVDDTPLRIQGRVGSGLYLAARTMGAPAGALQAYLKAIGSRVSLGRDVGAGDRFDLIVAQRRAATGEVETGDLLYAGLDRDGAKPLRLMRWTLDGREQWFEASGTGETRGGLQMPVMGHLTSNFGLRFHPILGYSRMHQGVDFGAPYGSPIVAAADGVVAFAGWHGGHGNYVRLNHAAGIATGYGHMSRIVARAGTHVRAGQLIGYVGSTGLSTGPHLHYELYRGGRPVNPLGVKFTSTAQLAGAELARFKAKLAGLLAVHAGAPAALRTAAKAPSPTPAG